MAYMNQDRKAKIVEAVNPILKKYKVKGSFKCDRHAITLTLREGGVDFLNDVIPERISNIRDDARQTYHFGVSPYWYQEHFTGITKQFFDEVMPALQAANWYDRSDIQVDYFNTAYYYHVQVGTWEKPYIVK